MANSFGPSGGKDPIAGAFEDAVDKSAGVVKIESEKIVDSFQMLMKNISKQMKGLSGPLFKQKGREGTARTKEQKKEEERLNKRAVEYAIQTAKDDRDRKKKEEERKEKAARKAERDESEAKRRREIAENKRLREEKRKASDMAAAEAKSIREEQKKQREDKKRSDDLAKEARKTARNIQRQEREDKKKSDDLAKEERRILRDQKRQESESKKKKDAEEKKKNRDERLSNKWDKMIEEETKKAEQEKSDKGKADIGAFFGFIDMVKGSFKEMANIVGTASKYVAAFNPGLVFQLGFAMKDLAATIGMALQPIVEGATAAVRNFADMLVPIAKEMQPILASLVSAFLDLFVQLFPVFFDLFQVLEIFIKVGIYLVQGFSQIMQPVIWYLEGFAAILAYRAIVAVISFAATLTTASALMTGGLSLLIGGVASLATSFGKATGFLDEFTFKPGASFGMGVRQASYTGVTEFGKNLLAQGLGSSAAGAATQTAGNTKRCADLLQVIADKDGKNNMGQMLGGDGVAKNKAFEQGLKNMGVMKP